MRIKRATLCLVAIGLCLMASAYSMISGGSFISPLGAWLGGGGSLPSGGNSRFASSIIGQSMGTSQMTGGPFRMFGGIVPGISPSDQAAKDLSLAHAFPVPWRSNVHTPKITFTNLTENATIKIYTLSGELVTTLNHRDPFSREEIWNLTNTDGERVASELYFFVIDSGNEIKKGRLMVIQ